MTENKRFKKISVCGDWGIKDVPNDKVLFFGTTDEVNDTFEVLNELHDENKELKEERKGFESCSHNWGILYDEAKNKVEELSKENKELKEEIEKIAYANDDLLKEKREWKKLSDEYAKIYDENKKLKQQYSVLEITLMNNQLAYNDLEKENKQLKQQFNYIQNSIIEHIKHQKTELGQKALQEIIEDYNEWLLGHKRL